MIAAVYVRVSTEGQGRDGTSLKSQEEACVKLAVRQGYEVPQDFILHERWTGTEIDRPMLNTLREFIRAKVVNAVVCYSTDRLARNPIHLAIIVEECEKRGIALTFVTEPLDSSREGKLICYVKGYAAQIEHEKIRERTIRGKKERARSGRLPQGTGKGVFGYSYNRDTGHRTILEAEAEVVRRIFKLASERNSFHHISQILNQEQIPTFSGGRWHPLTVKNMLTNSAYMGVTYYGQTKSISLGGNKRRLERRPRSEWIEVPGATPPIVPEEMFRNVQEIIAGRGGKRHCSSRKYLLTGHIVCGYCGGPMCGSTLSGRYRYYYCRRTRPGYAVTEKCSTKYVKADAIEEAVWCEISHVIKSPELIMAEIKRQKENIDIPSDTNLKRIEREIQACITWEQRLVRLYGFGEIDEDYIRKETLRAVDKRRGLEKERYRLQKQNAILAKFDVNAEKVKSFCYSVENKMRNLDVKGKSLALEALSIKVVAWPGRIELHGAVPSYVTIEQTSALLHEYSFHRPRI